MVINKKRKETTAGNSKPTLPVIGWREWVALPDMGIESIRVKVDSGAKTSSLYAAKLKKFKREDEDWVRFKVHPIQRNSAVEVEVEAKVADYRSVRSSTGKAEIRPVILTNITMMGNTWQIEVTLARRRNMKFRMLLGRQALQNRFLVDAGNSYYGGKPISTKPTTQQKKEPSPTKTKPQS